MNQVVCQKFIAQNNSKSEYKYLDLSLIDAQFKDSITNENYESIDSENGQCSRFRK
jgi:hypothetical protein